MAAFDFSQKAADLWHGSNFGVKRDILNCLCSNRTLTHETLTLTRRKPFDVLVEGRFLRDGGERWIRTTVGRGPTDLQPAAQPPKPLAPPANMAVLFYSRTRTRLQSSFAHNSLCFKAF